MAGSDNIARLGTPEDYKTPPLSILEGLKPKWKEVIDLYFCGKAPYHQHRKNCYFAVYGQKSISAANTRWQAWLKKEKFRGYYDWRRLKALAEVHIDMQVTRLKQIQDFDPTKYIDPLTGFWKTIDGVPVKIADEDKQFVASIKPTRNGTQITFCSKENATDHLMKVADNVIHRPVVLDYKSNPDHSKDWNTFNKLYLQAAADGRVQDAKVAAEKRDELDIKTGAKGYFNWRNPAIWVPIYRKTFHWSTTGNIYLGSRKSAKTTDALQDALSIMDTIPNIRVALVRQTKEDARNGLFKTACEIIQRLKLEHIFKIGKSPKIITNLRTGSTMECFGMLSGERNNKKGTGKGAGEIRLAIFDEADEIESYEQFMTFLLSMRGATEDMPLQWKMCLNPVPTDHWIVRKFFDDAGSHQSDDGSHHQMPSTDKDVTILHTTYLDNTFLTEAEKEQMRKVLEADPEYGATQVLGLLQTERTGLEFIKSFRDNHNTDIGLKWNQKAMLMQAWDFNKGQHTLSVWQEIIDHEAKTDTLQCIKEFRVLNGDIADTVDAFVEWCEEIGYSEYRKGDKSVVFVADYTSKKKTLGHSKRETSGHDAVLSRMKSYGFNMINESTPNEQNDQAIPFLDSVISGKVLGGSSSAGTEGYKLNVVIDAGCTYMLRDHRKSKVNSSRVIAADSSAKYRPAKRVWEGVSEAGHGIDTSKYIVIYVFRKEYDRRYGGD